MQKRFTNLLLAAVIAPAGIAALANGLAESCRAQDKKAPPKAEWVDPNKNAPNQTRYETFPSKVLGADVSYLAYLPPGYEKETKKYPVIYWLHGMGGNQRGGASVFVPNLDAAIRKDSLPPALVVCVNGMVNSFYCDAANGKVPIESVIVKDLIPHVDKTFRTIPKREGRVIQGYSMGGYGAAHLGFKYPELFGTVVVDAGALVREAALQGPHLSMVFKDVYGEDRDCFFAEHPTTLVEKNADKIRGKTTIRIGVGKDDSLRPRKQELHELLERLKIENQYEVVPDVAHNSAEYYRKLEAKGFDVHRKVFEALGKDG
jgi:endo-1,4-beta-xylanase